jgi:GMP synthase (glutamine-hydrolysing)
MATALCIRHEELDTFGVAPDALREGGLETVPFHAWEAGEDWPDVSGFDAFVVFGGSMSSLHDDAHPYLARERELLRRALDLGVPALGVCLGAQLLAQTFGGTVRPADEPEVGFKVLTLTPEGERDPVLSSFAGSAPAFEWHEDVCGLPQGATMLATGEGGSVQAYRIGSALGVQFHPEIDADEIESWIEASGDDLTPTWGREREEFRAEIAGQIDEHNQHGRAFFTAFARHALSAGARRSA